MGRPGWLPVPALSADSGVATTLVLVLALVVGVGKVRFGGGVILFLFLGWVGVVMGWGFWSEGFGWRFGMGWVVLFIFVGGEAMYE